MIRREFMPVPASVAEVALLSARHLRLLAGVERIEADLTAGTLVYREETAAALRAIAAEARA